MKQEELIKSCTNLLYKLCDLVKLHNTLNYYDINISSEYFFIPLLNKVFNCDLCNLNTEEKNAAAIDLYDTNGNIAIQVTSNSSASKIRTTLQKYRKKKLYEKYQRLVIIVIVPSHNYNANFSEDINGEFTFSKSDDIFTIDLLIKAISALDIENISDIKEYLEYQLDTMFDKTQVLSISQSFEYISQNTNNILNESYFEIDSDSFILEFQEKLDASNVIHISSLSIEEGKYCMLNLLHKIRPCNQVYVIKSKDSWDNADKYLSNCILIPEFQADEIPACKNNISLFIHSAEQSHEALRLPQRTISFLSNKLQENGYSDPYQLLQKTHGLYYYIKIELFTGKIKHPGWEKDNNRATIVATLLGKWSECDSDKAVIEKLYENSYDQFISYLNQYVGVEDAFIVRKYDISSSVIYELADPFLAVNSHRNVVDLPIITTFLEIARMVICARDPLFDEPIDTHFYISASMINNYSPSLKSGISRTLVLLALYANYQDEISRFVKDLLTAIHSINDWAYISQFIMLLCEASPDTVIDCLENNIDNHTGLLDLFTAEKDNILLGRHYYTNILSCLERLLKIKDYSVRAIKLLFEFGDKIDECSIGNNPREYISQVFCAFCNVSALEIEEKIELASIGAKKYPFFWNILYNEIGKNSAVFINSNFIYREADKIIPYTTVNLYHFYESYTHILLNNIGNDIDKYVKLLNLLPKCTYELFTAIHNKLSILIPSLGDADRERIKTTLRKIIYQHRHFANSEWSADPERVSKIEKICIKITFDDQAYDFLYLTESGDIPIFNPVAYDSEGDYYQKNETAIEEVIASEMARLKASKIDLGHYLELRKIKSPYTISRAIAKYYCNSNYDEQILDIIIYSTDDPRIAVSYVCNCSDSNLTEVYMAIGHLKNEHFADKFYVAFLSILPFSTESRSLILGLPDEAAQMYWKDFSQIQFDSKSLLNEAINNLILFSNWQELYLVVYKQESVLNTGEILTIIFDSTQKMIVEKYQTISNESYLIKQLLSVVYDRIDGDFESYPILPELEMQLFNVIGWNNMKSCQHLFKRNANPYADILSLIYQKGDGTFDETLDKDKIKQYLDLERNIKFCPGEENNSINKNILNDWLSTFKYKLESQNQIYLFYRKIGQLFAYSPVGIDGISPHELIREKIEEIGNDELINSFASTIIYSRGVHYVTAGRDELKLGQKYEEISKKLSICYPKTSKIFSIISKHYYKESETDRKIAESNIH